MTLFFLLSFILSISTSIAGWAVAQSDFTTATFSSYPGWTIFSLAAPGSFYYTCGANSVFGGPNIFGKSSSGTQTTITQNVVNLPLHSLIRIQLTAYGFNQWANTGTQVNDKLIIKDLISGNILATFNFDAATKTNMCQSSFNEIKVSVREIFSHSATTIQLQIYAVTTNMASLQSWGIRDYSISSVQSSQCPQSCAICNPSGSCTECYPKFLLTADPIAICVTVCPAGYYAGTNLCLPCHSTCLTCNGGNFNNCLSCNTSIFTYFSSKNTCECKDHYYYSATNCLPCDASCDSCSNSSTCLSCLQGYYSNTLPATLCTSCLEQCQSCTSLSSCTSCSSVKHRVALDSVCQCVDGYFERSNSLVYNQGLTRASQASSDYGACIKCSSGCLICQDESSCSKCILGDHRVLRGGYCRCKQLYKENAQGVCEKYEPEESSYFSSLFSSSAGIILLAAIPSILLGNPAFFLSMMDIIQVLKYILFIDISYPDIVVLFFGLFDWTDGSFLGNIVQDNTYVMLSPNGFYLNGVDSLFLRNSGFNVILFPALILFYLAVKFLPDLINQYLKNQEKELILPGLNNSKIHLKKVKMAKQNKCIEYIKEKAITIYQYFKEILEYGAFLSLMEAVYLNLWVSSFLQIQNGSITCFAETISYFFAVVSILILFWHFFVIIKVIRKIPSKITHILISEKGEESQIVQFKEEKIKNMEEAGDLDQEFSGMNDDEFERVKNLKSYQSNKKLLKTEEDMKQQIVDEEERLQRQYDVIISLFIRRNLQQRGYYIWMCLKRCLFAFCLVFMYKVPVLILACWISMNILTIFILIKYKPFKERIYALRDILTELFYMIIHILTLPLADFTLLDQDQKLIFGWIIITFCILVIVIQVIFISGDAVQQVRQFMASRIPIPKTPIIPITPTPSREPVPPVILTEYQKLKIGLTKANQYIKMTDIHGQKISTDQLTPALRDHLMMLENQMAAAHSDIELQIIRNKYEEAVFLIAVQQRLEEHVKINPKSKRILSREVNELLPAQLEDFNSKKVVKKGDILPMYAKQEELQQVEIKEENDEDDLEIDFSQNINKSQAQYKLNPLNRSQLPNIKEKEISLKASMNKSVSQAHKPLQQNIKALQLGKDYISASQKQEALISSLPLQKQEALIPSFIQNTKPVKLEKQLKEIKEDKSKEDVQQSIYKSNKVNESLTPPQTISIQQQREEIKPQRQLFKSQMKDQFEMNNNDVSISQQSRYQQNEDSEIQPQEQERKYKKKQTRQVKPINANRVENINDQLEELQQ